MNQCVAEFNALLDQVRSQRLGLLKSATRDVISCGTQLSIDVVGTQPERPIKGVYVVEKSGYIALGPGYDRVNVLGLEFREAEFAIQHWLLQELVEVEVMVTLPRGELTNRRKLGKAE